MPLTGLARLERRALLAVVLALLSAERRPPARLQMRRLSAVDDAHAVDERGELLDGADVLRVQLEAITRTPRSSCKSFRWPSSKLPLVDLRGTESSTLSLSL